MGERERERGAVVLLALAQECRHPVLRRAVRKVQVSLFTVVALLPAAGPVLSDTELAGEHVLYLAQPFGFALLAVGLLLWTGSLWAAVGVHGGFHVGNYLAVGFLHHVDAVTSWLAIGGVQAAIGLVLVVTALRRGKRILDGDS